MKRWQLIEGVGMDDREHAEEMLIRNAKHDYSIHQDGLFWSRVQTLIALQSATLAGSFYLHTEAKGQGPYFALLLTGLGMCLTVLLWIMAERDQLHREASRIAAKVPESKIEPSFPLCLSGESAVRWTIVLLLYADVASLLILNLGGTDSKGFLYFAAMGFGAVGFLIADHAEDEKKRLRTIGAAPIGTIAIPDAPEPLTPRLKMKKKPKVKIAKVFIDGLDSYQHEYVRWKRIHGVARLIGVFELSDEEFNSGTVADRLRIVGQQHFSPILFEDENDSSGPLIDSDSVASGITCAVRDMFGEVRSIVFVRKSVRHSAIATADQQSEVDYGIRLAVLLHELGHADDISKSTNFNHVESRVDRTAAELYAHNFLIGHAKRLNYRLMLEYYLDSLEEQAASTEQAVQIAAKTALDLNDVVALRKWIAEGKDTKAMIVKYGRGMDAMRKNSKQ
jgi:hypothetical protein